MSVWSDQPARPPTLSARSGRLGRVDCPKDPLASQTLDLNLGLINPAARTDR